MPISKDLFLALLSMDSYNRGYGAGVSEVLRPQGVILEPTGDCCAITDRPVAMQTGVH